MLIAPRRVQAVASPTKRQALDALLAQSVDDVLAAHNRLIARYLPVDGGAR